MKARLRLLLRIAAVTYTIAVSALVLGPDLAFEDPAREVATSISPRTPDPDPQPMQQVERVGWNRLDALVNLLLLMPLGALVAAGWRGPAIVNAVVAVGLAAAFELLQLAVFRHRSAELSDALLNVTGSVVAFAAVRLTLARRQADVT